jgi:hypothetical protein
VAIATFPFFYRQPALRLGGLVELQAEELLIDYVLSVVDCYFLFQHSPKYSLHQINANSINLNE